MPILVPVGLAVLAYLYLTDKLDGARAWNWVCGILATLGAGELLVKGQWGTALVVLALGFGWIGWRQRDAPARPADAADARAVLGVDAAATADDIRAAHRRLIAQVHPDKGGSADLARRVNAARDYLLKHGS